MSDTPDPFVLLFLSLSRMPAEARTERLGVLRERGLKPEHEEFLRLRFEELEAKRAKIDPVKGKTIWSMFQRMAGPRLRVLDDKDEKIAEKGDAISRDVSSKLGLGELSLDEMMAQYGGFTLGWGP